MNFSEFATRLKRIIGGGNNTVQFTKSLFECILPDDDDLMDGYSVNTLKAYFNGTSPISKLAKKIRPIMQKEGFEEFIDEFEGDVTQSLADAFIDVAPEINACNCAIVLSDIFKKIIEDAAATEKKTPSSTKKEKKMTEDQKEIFDNLSGPLLTFAKAVDNISHTSAEKSRQNKKTHESAQSDVETIEAEIVTDEEPSSSADSNGNTTIIQHQTIVTQNGDNNVNITNNGTMNLNF